MDLTCTNTCRGRPVEVLKHEHRLIERGLDALETVMEEPRLDAAFLRTAIDFFRTFADSCHHAKEEDQLFPVLESAGMPREGGPIGCMLHEHRLGRELVRQMSDSLDAHVGGDASAECALRQAAAQYIVMLRQHILKEDNVLFMMADRMLDSQRQSGLSAAFDQVTHAPQHRGRYEQYSAIADRMTERANARTPNTNPGV